MYVLYFPIGLHLISISCTNIAWTQGREICGPAVGRLPFMQPLNAGGRLPQPVTEKKWQAVAGENIPGAGPGGRVHRLDRLCRVPTGLSATDALIFLSHGQTRARSYW